MRESIKNNLSQLIEHAFQQFAQLPAYNFNEKSYSYSELDSISQTIANHLKEKYPNQIYIGVYAVKSFETFASIIGIIRAGKAFVPISPKFPPAKLQRIIEKSKIKTLIDLNSKITQQQKHTVYPAVEILNSVSTFSPQGSKVQPIEDTKPAYLLFTSGTTGDPKEFPSIEIS